MKTFIVNCGNLVREICFNGLHQLVMTSQHYPIRVLAWLWSIICSLCFLSIFQFQIMWLAFALIICGLFASYSVFKYAESRPAIKKIPVRSLSHASKCVWQMDREA